MRRLGLMLLLIASSITSIWVQGQNQATSPATPTLIKFGGTINSASGTLNVIFALYAEQTGGAPLWLETQKVNLDAKGHYKIFLGANHANGVPMDLFASGEARWLGVQPEGQAEQARVMLVSVPYAINAGDAQTLGGQPLSAFVLASAATGSTTTASSATTACCLWRRCGAGHAAGHGHGRDHLGGQPYQLSGQVHYRDEHRELVAGV